MPAEILTRDQARLACERLRSEGKTIAFPNGCFDLIQVGHIRYLRGARASADILIVAVNSDESVRENKGDGRPLTPLSERLEVLSYIEPVDYLVPFDEMSPASLILELKPHYQCKGTDYTPESVPERKAVESYGGKVLIVGDPKDHSSTELMNRIKENDTGN